MLENKLETIIAHGEGISVEFKECRNVLPKSVFPTVCSFLNRFGGDLILGVDDSGEILGVDTGCLQQIKKDMVSALNNPQKIYPTVYLHVDECQLQGRNVLHVYVPESSQVHSVGGRIYDRNEDGDFDITANTDLVAQLYVRKQREYTENMVFPYAAMTDLREDLIDRARMMAVHRSPHHPWERMTNEEILRSAGLYRKNLQTGECGYTLACILLFGTDEAILSVLPHHKTDAVFRARNLDHYDDRDVIRCNLLESYDRLMTFVEKHTNDKFFLDGDVRVSVRNRLFREVIANMLIHREYTNAYPARLLIDSETVETENGNKARKNGVMDPSDFAPYPKNPMIASVFKEIGWAEELGSGIRNTVKYSAEYTGKPPLFIDGDVFRTVIPLIQTENEVKNEVENEVKNEVENEGAFVSENLVAVEKQLICLIRENPRITRVQMAQKVGKSKSTIDRVLSQSRKIARNGPRKGGYWYVRGEN